MKSLRKKSSSCFLATLAKIFVIKALSIKMDPINFLTIFQWFLSKSAGDESLIFFFFKDRATLMYLRKQTKQLINDDDTSCYSFNFSYRIPVDNWNFRVSFCCSHTVLLRFELRSLRSVIIIIYLLIV